MGARSENSLKKPYIINGIAKITTNDSKNCSLVSEAYSKSFRV